jgi:metal-sulfur cluster biosynthetic enzyme
MLRDAIVEVLRGTFDASGQGDAISLVDAGLIGQVAVADDRVRIDLTLSPKWSPFVRSLVSEVERRIQALPEVRVTEIAVVPGEASFQADLGADPAAIAAPVRSTPEELD